MNNISLIPRQLIAILLLTVSTAAHAYLSPLHIQNTLENSGVTCVTQDSYGYIWAGTDFGLKRYDGYQFNSYANIPGDTTSIGEDEINCLFSDSRKRMWIGTRKGLSRYNYLTNSFINYKFPKGRTPRVVAIVEDKSGNIIFGTSGYGLYAIPSGSDKVEHLHKFKEGDIYEFVNNLFIDGQDALWVCSHLNRAIRYTGNIFKPKSEKRYTLPYGAATSILINEPGGAVIALQNGIVRFDYRTGAITDAGYDLSLLNDNIASRRAIMTHSGDIMIGTSSNGLWTIRYGTRKATRLAYANAETDLNSAGVFDLWEDNGSNLWLCCYGNGLYMLRQDTDNPFRSMQFADFNIKLGGGVKSIAKGDGGDTFVAVRTGLYRFSSNGEITSCPNSPNGIVTIYRDRQGRYWLGRENSLYSYNPYTGQSKNMLELNGWGVYSIADNGSNELYISNYAKGLTIYNTATGTAEHISMKDPPGKGATLVNDWIKTLFTDSRKRLWIGTADGVSCMDTETHRFYNFKKNKTLEGYTIFSFAESRQGEIYAGTSHGLFVFDSKHSMFRPVTDTAEMGTLSIRSIATDSRGYVWLGTQNGIWTINKDKRLRKAYAWQQRGASNEFTTTPPVAHAGGLIAMATTKGIVTFTPGKTAISKMRPDKVWLTSILANNKPVLKSTDGTFRLTHNENNIQMFFSTFNYKNTDYITFEYSLGGGKSWTSLGEGVNALKMAELPPGTYNFHIRATCNGETSETETVSVVIASPWYASTTAFMIYVLAAAIIISITIRLYIRRHKRLMEESKMQFIINATHDIRTPLTLITEPLAKLNELCAGLPECKRYIDTIDRNASRLLLLTNQILDTRKIDKKSMQLHYEHTEMVRYISGQCSMFQYNAEQHGISLTFYHSGIDKLYAWIDPANFSKVISNLISNSLKYTAAGGEIQISLKAGATHLTIVLADNGCGFRTEDLPRLFERFYQGENARKISREGSGIGLNLTRAIVQLHGGTIYAQNRTDGSSGAMFVVDIPLGKEHINPEQIDCKRKDMTDEPKRQASKNISILIADDDIDICQYIAGELGKWYKCHTCSNGKEALEKMSKQHYDLVVSDVVMPQMGGMALLKAIKSTPESMDIPVVMLTSHTEARNKLESLHCGADAYLPKPFNIAELHATIDNLINNVRRLRGKYTGQLEQKDKVDNIKMKGNNDILMERIMKSVNANLSDPEFNVEALTDNIGISRAQLHRKIKEITGVPTGEFIRNIRLNQAARLLTKGNVDVVQVAYAVGFVNQSHFSTLFKKHFGMSPSEYIKAHKTDEA